MKKYSEHLDRNLAVALHGGIRIVPDFPKPGIIFRDATPLVADTTLRDIVATGLLEPYLGVGGSPVDAVVGIDARGFVFGMLLADRLGVPFILARKAGKLPGPVDRVAYRLEYGEAALEMPRGSIKPGQRVSVVDDLLATGGTASAAGQLVRMQGGIVASYDFVVELDGLGGRACLDGDGEGASVHALLAYE